MGLFTSTPRSVTKTNKDGSKETKTYGKSGGLDKIQHTDRSGKTHEHNVGHGLLGSYTGSKKK